MRANQWTGPRTPAQHLWERVDKSGDCWLWVGPVDVKGYGQTAAGKAHRVSWAIANGPIPAGMLVCHHCDNPPCVRPDHLFLGSAADNSADMVAKGRQARGAAVYPKGPRAPKRKRDLGETCKRGHDRATYTTVRASGHRECGRCHAERVNAAYHAMRAAA